MGEMSEISVPVDQRQPSEIGIGGSLELSEVTAVACYNARAEMAATTNSAPEQSGNDEATFAGQANGENGGTDKGATESPPRQDSLMSHWNPKTREWDNETQEKMRGLDRKRMFSSNYSLPTDFHKYFDIRSGMGPKQPEESKEARGKRHLDELKAWHKKVEEKSALAYNRKAGKAT